MRLFSQTNTLPVTGNVGIGTTTPSALLHLKGSDGLNANTCVYANSPLFKLDYYSGNTMNCPASLTGSGTTGSPSDMLSIRSYPLATTVGGPGYNSIFEINGSGQVGIGTYPTLSYYKLQVGGHALLSGNTQIKQKLRINNTALSSNDYLSFPYSFSVDYGKSRFMGDVIIQGINTQIGSTIVNQIKLGTDGYIRAREIQVDLQSIPDYVFKADYNLLSIDSLENYINKNGHLPNVKSESEFVKEGSYSLGEMNIKLLEKIEELTLYLIQQQKEIDNLKGKQIDSIEKIGKNKDNESNHTIKNNSK